MNSQTEDSFSEFQKEYACFLEEMSGKEKDGDPPRTSASRESTKRSSNSPASNSQQEAEPMTENRQNLGGMWNQENPAANEQHGMPGRFPYPRSGGPHYTQQSMSPPHPHENPYNARQGPYGTQYVVAPPFTATSPPGQPPFQHPNPHGQYESFANMFPPGSIPTSAPPGYQQHQQLPNNFTPAGQNGYPQNFYGQQQCDPNGTIPNSQNPHAAFWPQMGYGQQNPTNGQASGTAGPQGMPFFPQQPQQHQTFPQNPTFPIGNSQPDITAFAEHLKSKQESTTPPTFHESPKKASSVGYGKYKNQDKKRKGIKGKERKPKQQA
ncbi:unnamed protein product, partial [Mesorhabditis belari]|uniref:Uncharacterized protein n=1 Tax=Mesorhabditis belari TaxID=2138241 RepID=A0AAF3FI44_9BILA